MTAKASADGPRWLDAALKKALPHLARCSLCRLGPYGRVRKCDLPSHAAVQDVLDSLIGVLFPGCHGTCPIHFGDPNSGVAAQLRAAAARLHKQVEQALRYQCQAERCRNCGDCRRKAQRAVTHLIDSLSDVQRTLEQDVRAAYEGDPAARSPMEIVMSYPCLQAIATHRLAHLLYEQGIPLIPRVMSELAHSRTGIDIHPGARIGPGFFIDHGTGVVIGETCIIGRNVKIYQGVTLGALSFPKDKHGRLIKGIKRHPEVRDNVTIYAEATILGGDTVIGEGSEIGGNVWLTHSVPPHSKVYNRSPALLVKKKRAQPGGRKTMESQPIRRPRGGAGPRPIGARAHFHRSHA